MPLHLICIQDQLQFNTIPEDGRRSQPKYIEQQVRILNNRLKNLLQLENDGFD